ncbi:MAG: HEAT repeat domain-containing protein [Elusimicrobiota bacterium]|jgi:HEAT repeat protein
MSLIPQFSSRRSRRLFYVGAVLLAPLAIVWVIAGSDRLFLRTVPLEQRLVSPNETIRKRAQQDLLGFESEAKQRVAEQLIPSLDPANDPFTRKWATIAIALIGPPAQEAIPALLQGVSAPQRDVAQASKVALSEVGAPDPQQLPALLQSLGDPREPVQCEAANSIAKMGPAAEKSIPVLISRLKKENPAPPCFVSAISQLCVFLPQAVDPLLELLQDPRPGVRRNAVAVLGQVETLPVEAEQALLTVLGIDADSDVRRDAARALALPFPPDRGLLPTLQFALRRSKNDSVRLSAIGQLKKTASSTEEMVPVLAEALRDPGAEVRLASLRWLAELDGRSRPALGVLLQLLKDPDVRVKRASLGVLRQILIRRGDALPLIARAQRDPDPMVRCLAAEQLVEMGAWDRIAVERLVADLSAEGEGTLCAREALSQAGHFNPEVVSYLIRLLQGGDRSLRSDAAAILMQLGVKAREALPALHQAQKDRIPGAEAASHAIRDALLYARRSRR